MQPNPNDPPDAAFDRPFDVVDRVQRVALAEIVRGFLDEELTAFEFDERLAEFHDSPVATVRFVAGAVWYFYDDCDDHLVALAKPEWDCIQRLLLLLESDRSAASITRWRWSWTQLIAAVALGGFVLALAELGWGYHLLAVAMPLGIVSIGISWLRGATADAGPYDPLLYPFGTFADLRAAYDAAAFKKLRCPRHVKLRQIRSQAIDLFHRIHLYVVWLAMSPVPLAFQILPQREERVRVVAS